MRFFWVCLFLLFAITSSAEFTPDEKLELQELIRASHDVSDALAAISLSVEAGTAPQANVAEAVKILARAADEVGLAQGWLFHTNVKYFPEEAEPILNGPRSGVVAKGFELVDTAIGSLQGAISYLVTVQDSNAATAAVEAQMAIDRLQSIDRTLTYEEPFPASYPTIVGPHGSHNRAARTIWLAQTFNAQAIAEVGRAYANGATDRENLADAIYYGALTNRVAVTVWGLDSKVILPEDWDKILFDHNASSQIRPPEFFTLALALELSLNGGGSNPILVLGEGTNVFGRTLENGVAHYLFSMGYPLSVLAGDGALNQTARAHIRTAIEFWNNAQFANQLYGSSAILFLQAPPNPPSNPGPCPPPPPPPVLSLEMTLNPDGVTGEVRCIQQ